MYNCSVTLSFTGITKHKTAAIMKKALQASILESDHAPVEYVLCDSQKRKWYILNDGRISPLRKSGEKYVSASDRYRVSLKTPMMSFRDTSCLLHIISLLEENGAVISEKSLMPIEVDISRYGSREMTAMLNFINTYSRVICHLFEIHMCSYYHINFYSSDIVERINNAAPRTVSDFYAELVRVMPEKPLDPFVSTSPQSCWEKLMFFSQKPLNTVTFGFFKMHFDVSHIRSYFQFVNSIVQYVYQHADEESFQPTIYLNNFNYTEWFDKIGFGSSAYDSTRYTIMMDFQKVYNTQASFAFAGGF